MSEPKIVLVVAAALNGVIGRDGDLPWRLPSDLKRFKQLTIGKPVVIHTREATDDTLAVLRDAGGGRVRAVMHCFSGSIDDARRALELGFYISLAGILTFPKAGALREVAAFVPEDRLLIETDAPFLAPVPHRGKRNEPAHVTRVAEVIAELRNASAEAVAEATSENFDRLFVP